MKSVLIVDDELTICKGLIRLSLWDDLGIRVAGYALNGREALRMMEKEPVDLLLTDIHMPDMNGLELIHHIREHRIKTDVVVLSGYDDFDFVRESLRYGARNYLLKPIDQKELFLSIKEILEENRAKKDHFSYRELYIQNICNRIVEGQVTLSHLEERESTVNLRLSRCVYHLMLLDVYDDREPELFRRLTLIHSYMKEAFGDGMLGVPFLTKDNLTAALFFDRNRSFAPIEKSGGFLGLRSFLGETICPCYSLAVSMPCDNFKAIPKIYESLKEERILTMLEGFEDSPRLQTGTHDRDGTRDPKARCAEILEGRTDLVDPDRLRDYCETLFHISRPPEEIKAKMTAAYVFYCLSRNSKTSQDILNKNSSALYHLSRADSRPHIREHFEGVLRLDREIRQRESGYSREVQSLLDHIEKSYSDNTLSLKSLAWQLDTNATNLGRRFKQETGEYFSEKLNRHRIEMATEKLLHTMAPANKIARDCGFNSQNYFYTLFKKIKGMRPTELRNS